MRRFVLAALCAVLPTSVALAAAPPPSAARAHHRSVRELRRLRRVHLLNWKERDMGDLAADRAADSRVKRLGEELSEDTQAVDRDLLEYAHENEIFVDVASHPPEEVELIESEMRNLRLLRGAAFDGRFLRDLLQNDQAILGELRLALQGSDDAELSAVLDRAIGVVTAHRERAEALLHAHH